MQDFPLANKQSDKSKPRTVLLVEDDRAIRLFLRRPFSEAGFQISEVSTGGEALEALSQEPPDGVVLDLGLPDKLSGSVLGRLKELEIAAEDPPIWIIMSALDVEEAVRRYGPLGRHFLAKPFDPWDLVSMLETALSEKDRL